MKLINSEKSNVITETFTIDNDGQTLIYTQYIDSESGKLIDEDMRDGNGEFIQDAILLKQVIELVDNS